MFRLVLFVSTVTVWRAYCALGFNAQIQRRSGLTRTMHRHSSSSPGLTVVFLAPNEEESYSDFLPPEEVEEYKGSVDWDAEWKKVMASEGKLEGGKERPGSGFYKSEAEIKAIKAANVATEKLVEAGSTMSKVIPDVRSLSGDWRFWIAILALVSVGLAVLTAPQNIAPSGLQGDSYYI